MMNYLKKQIEAIRQSPSLKVYGFFLSLTHIWTFFYWNKRGFFVSSQSEINVEPLCFPIFPDCDLFRQSLSPETWQWILYAYLFVAALSCVLWFGQRVLGWAYSALALVTAFKLFLHLSNYNFMGNYHYMAHAITLAFLFVPAKDSVIKTLIVSFYLAAGFLKINIDWLSGAAMIRTPWLTGELLSLSLFYVLFLELIFVFGLIHPKRWIRWFCLMQFLAFHIFSWHIVGFYYPLIMFCLLSIFIYDEYFLWKNNRPVPNILENLLKGKEPKVVYATLIVFFSLQIFPFIITPDPSLSGAARLSSLNMFDSKTQCHSLLVAHTDRGSTHIRRSMKNLGVRLRCDPLIFLNQAHQLCRKNKKFKEINRLSLQLFSKRVTSQHYKKVLDINDVCSLEFPLWAEVTH